MHKRILVVTDNLRNQVNGVVTTFKNLEGLARRDGYSIVYIDPGQFPHVDCPGYPEVKLSLPWRMGAKIAALAPDHIHIATEGPLGLAARLWCDRHARKYNTSYHTKFPEFLHRLYGVPPSWVYKYVRWFHKHSGKVLTTTETMVKELQAHGFCSNIVPWTRGVDRGIFHNNMRSSEACQYPLMLSVGRVSKEKNLDDFCALTVPGAVKVVVGDGPYRSELERKYPDVMFVGAQFGEALARYYANADVMVFTSRLDTFGIVMLESMACGTPVAAYPVAGPLDILCPGINGVMHEDLHEAVTQALQLDRRQVYESSKKWSWQNCWRIFKNNLIAAS
jgi:glycosyltransferase involved in cell wall biosynthesis